MAKRYDPIMCMLVDEPTKAQDADPIAALSNFKKTAEYGDSIKIDIGKGKTAIVQKEANGWYATIGNEKVKGTFNVIAGYLKSASAKDSASALDKAIKTCDAVDVDRISNYLWLWVEGSEVASMLFNAGLDKYSGPHDKEHKEDAYDFAKKYPQQELDAILLNISHSFNRDLRYSDSMLFERLQMSLFIAYFALLMAFFLLV